MALVCYYCRRKFELKDRFWKVIFNGDTWYFCSVMCLRSWAVRKKENNNV